MEFGTVKPYGKARVVPAASVVGWWCVVDGNLVIDMVADLDTARICCRIYNGIDACTGICAERCSGAPDFPAQQQQAAD